ncbi:MAG: efflux RND transporter permease subunit [Pseudomonadota bacterium]
MSEPAERLPRGGVIGWAARHPVLPNLIMLLLVIGGLIAVQRVVKEVFPPFNDPWVMIDVALPGATPGEVMEAVTVRIESPMAELSNAGPIWSWTNSGTATVAFDAIEERDKQELLTQAQQIMSTLRTLPEDAERPNVRLNKEPKPILDVHVHGAAEPGALRAAAERVASRLEAEAGISTVRLKDAPKHEILVEVSRTMLRATGATLGELALAISRATEDRSGGRIATSRGDVQLRVDSSLETVEAFRALPITLGDEGQILRLGDIARVQRGFEENDTSRFFDGRPAVMMQVMRVGDESPLAISEAAGRAVADIRRLLPEGIDVTVANDRSTLFADRVDLLLRNGLVGLALVLLLLSAFLEFRLAFWVAVGIPTAFLGAFLLLPLAGVTVNMVSLFAFIVALGLVVDDAIVAGENIYEYRERGLAPADAAVQGARDIAVPLSFSIVTNIIAFIPLAMVPGWFGAFWVVIPIVVASAFLVSWLEALFVLPGHLAGVRRRERASSRLARLRHVFSDGLAWVVRRLYAPLLSIAISWRYTTVALMVLILVLTVAWPVSGRMGFSLFPPIPRDTVQLLVGLDDRAPEDAKQKVLRHMLETVEAVKAENGGERLVRYVATKIEASKIELDVYLARPSVRTMESTEFADAVRERLGQVPEIRWTNFRARFGGGNDEVGIEVWLGHPSTEELSRAADALVARLKAFDAVKSARKDQSSGPEQLTFRVTEAGRALGFTARIVGEQVRHAFLGVEAMKLQEEGNEVTLRLRLPGVERRSEYDIATLILRAPDGTEAPLYEIADVSRARAEGLIMRRNGSRIVKVFGKLSPPEAESQVVAALKRDVLPGLAADFPGLTSRFGGEEETKRQTLDSFKISLALALALMYAALAIPFRSWIQPMIVMAAIPFGFAGAIIGHLIMGMGLSIISLFGVIALGGVVINAALVMIDYANKARIAGADAIEAMMLAGTRRFRPILLTTLTTFGGLAPMIFETSAQAKFLVPMAVSLGYGIVFATAIVLFLIPCLYIVVEDLRWLANPRPRRVAPETQPAR